MAELPRVRWLYHFTDMLNNRLLATLPMAGASFTEVLSGVGSAEGSVPLTSAKVRQKDPWSATIPRRSVCWAQRVTYDPVTGQAVEAPVLWAGPVVTRTRSRNGRAMQLGMISWAGYFAHRLLTTDLNYAASDKLVIFRAILYNALLAVGGGVPVSMPNLTGGPVAQRTYLASDLKPTLETLQQLAASGDGFDWRLRHLRAADAAGTFSAVVDAGYPRLGRIMPADLVWSSDDNDSRYGQLLDYTIREDGSNVHNRITALGSGTGPLQLRSTVTAADVGRDELGYGYPLWESSLGGATNELTTQAALDQHAYGAMLQGLAGEVEVDNITVRGDLNPVVTSYQLGDDVTLRLADDVSPGQGLIIVGKLVGRKMTPATPSSTEKVTMTLQVSSVRPLVNYGPA